MPRPNRRPKNYTYTNKNVNFFVIQKRIELIRLVKEEGYKLLHAAEILHINYSTAKMIMLKYRNTGKITSFNREEQNPDYEHDKTIKPQITSSNVNDPSEI